MYLKEGLNMPDNELFSGIPSLDDQQGLENLLNQQALESMGVNAQIPSALEQNVDQNTQQISNPAPQQQETVYTSEQISQIVARNQQLEEALKGVQQNQQSQVRQAQQNQQPLYSERQRQVINELLNRGVPIERIAAALNKGRQNNITAQRLQNIEQYLQQQEYNKALNDFEQKMLTFGNKFGLSEDDLVYFGNLALEKGINVAYATDLESVFRAVLPEQYALRIQRINNNPTSQIYGGVNIGEPPRAAASKAEDAYVDAFMKQTMPNQYSMLKK